MRLAPVVGIVAAGWHSWNVLQRYQMNAASQASMSLTYACAARQSDDLLAARQNPLGNINVRDLCLAGRDFYVSWPEVQAMRAGTLKFETTFRPVDWQGSAVIGAAWTLLAVLVALGVLFVIAIARWVWGASGREQAKKRL